MATQPVGNVAPRPPAPVTPPHMVAPSPPAARSASVAARSAATSPPPHAAVWQPWEQVAKAAEARLKTEISDALRVLDLGARQAGAILDTAQAQAAEAGAHLRNAAWAAFSRYMELADRTENGITGPAAEAYSNRIAQLDAMYNQALASALRNYRTVLADAQAAKAAAGQVPSGF